MKKRFAAAAGSGSGFRRSLGALALMLTCGVFAAFSALPAPALAGPPPGMQVATGDVVTDADGAPMAAGYMPITQGSFPWTLNYDEVQIVLEDDLDGGANVLLEQLGQRVAGGVAVLAPWLLQLFAPATYRPVHFTASDRKSVV